MVASNVSVLACCVLGSVLRQELEKTQTRLPEAYSLVRERETFRLACRLLPWMVAPTLELGLAG